MTITMIPCIENFYGNYDENQHENCYEYYAEHYAEKLWWKLDRSTIREQCKEKLSLQFYWKLRPPWIIYIKFN